MSAQTGYITYSSVCYGRTVLAEGFQTHGPFTIIARKLLDKINDEGRKQKRTFEIKEFLFYFFFFQILQSTK